MTDRLKGILWKVAKAALGAAVFGYVIYSGRVNLGRIGDAEPWPVACGFAVLLLVPVVGWLRWSAVIRAQGIELGAYGVFRLQMIGVFFNAFLFGSTGGDALKMWYLATGAGSGKKAAAVMTIGLDRLFGLVALFLLLGSQIPFAWDVVAGGGRLAVFVEAAAALYVFGIAATGLLLVPRLRARRRRRFERWSKGGGLRAKVARALDQADEALQEIVRKPLTSAYCVALSLVGHLATIVAFYLFGRALGSDSLSFREYIVLAPLALAVTGLPVLPLGGLGAGEFFASEIFRVAAEVGKWFGGTLLFLWRIGLFTPAPVGFVYFVIHRDEIRRARQAAAGAAAAEAPAGREPA